MSQDAEPIPFDDLVRHGGLPRIEARALLERATGHSRTYLIAHGDEAASDDEIARFHRLAEARRAGQPMAYLLGEREFLGRLFQVDASTLIPRPETELLVEIGQACLEGRPAPTVIDLGTGSGIVAISLALARPDAQVWATDRSMAALAVASRNAEALGARIAWHQGDWWQALATADEGAPAFDLIVSNPPYIAAADPHLDQGDLRFEPRDALTPGPSGTEAIEQILAGCGRHLRPGGWIAFEHGHDQGQAVRRLLRGAGLEAIETRRDLAGLERITLGRSGNLPASLHSSDGAAGRALL